ncbi:MAG: hypothetical protein ACFCVE_16135 [Phycisphaerae bacterium]
MQTPRERVVVFGAGCNDHDKRDAWYPAWLSRCDLVGVRDWGQPFDWVPCVSCLSPAFDDPGEPEHDVVVYRHKDPKSDRIPRDLGWPSLTNRAGFNEVIRFLKSGRTVVTSSYHGVSWATLLGRKVVVCSPFSSRFITSGISLYSADQLRYLLALGNRFRIRNRCKNAGDRSSSFPSEPSRH